MFTIFLFSPFQQPCRSLESQAAQPLGLPKSNTTTATTTLRRHSHFLTLAPSFFFFFFFFVYSLLACDYPIMVRLCTVRSLSAIRAVAACCKLPFAPRPGLSPDVMRTNGITREKRKEKNVRKKGNTPPRPYTVPADAMKSGVGRNSGVLPAPGSSAPARALPATPAPPPRTLRSPCPLTQRGLSFPRPWA